MTDPHWDALAAQLDRIHAARGEVAALVAQVTAERALPADHPARSLDYRLAQFTPTKSQAPAGPTGPGDGSLSRDSPTADALGWRADGCPQKSDRAWPVIRKLALLLVRGLAGAAG